MATKLEQTADEKLLEQVSRHSVLLERLKAGEVKKFETYLRRADTHVRDQLTRKELTTYGRSRLEDFLGRVGGKLLEIYKAFSDRMLEIAVGVAVGVVVNLLVFPPLRDRQASRYVDSVNERMGSVLKNMGEEFADSWGTDRAQAWVEETEAISAELDSAWSTVKFARESRRANPRFYFYRLRREWGIKAAEAAESQAADASWEEILRRSGEGVSRLRNLSRTMRDEGYDIGNWNDRFREEWAQLARDAGRAIADPDAEVESLSDRLEQLARDMSGHEDLLNDHWPVYGSMITDLRYIVEIVDDVASSREAREASNTPE